MSEAMRQARVTLASIRKRQEAMSMGIDPRDHSAVAVSLGELERLEAALSASPPPDPKPDMNIEERALVAAQLRGVASQLLRDREDLNRLADLVEKDAVPLREARQEGAVAQIVKWLRGTGASYIADCIERGAWKKSPPGTGKEGEKGK